MAGPQSPDGLCVADPNSSCAGSAWPALGASPISPPPLLLSPLPVPAKGALAWPDSHSSITGSSSITVSLPLPPLILTHVGWRRSSRRFLMLPRPLPGAPPGRLCACKSRQGWQQGNVPMSRTVEIKIFNTWLFQRFIPTKKKSGTQGNFLVPLDERGSGCHTGCDRGGTAPKNTKTGVGRTGRQTSPPSDRLIASSRRRRRRALASGSGVDHWEIGQGDGTERGHGGHRGFSQRGPEREGEGAEEGVEGV
jgi:hypothetical protein